MSPRYPAPPVQAATGGVAPTRFIYYPRHEAITKKSDFTVVASGNHTYGST